MVSQDCGERHAGAAVPDAARRDVSTTVPQATGHRYVPWRRAGENEPGRPGGRACTGSTRTVRSPARDEVAGAVSRARRGAHRPPPWRIGRPSAPPTGDCATMDRCGSCGVPWWPSVWPGSSPASSGSVARAASRPRRAGGESCPAPTCA